MPSQLSPQLPCDNSCTWAYLGISCAQVYELPPSHCGDNREGTLFSWLHIYKNLYGKKPFDFVISYVVNLFPNWSCSKLIFFKLSWSCPFLKNFALSMWTACEGPVFCLLHNNFPRKFTESAKGTQMSKPRCSSVETKACWYCGICKKTFDFVIYYVVILHYDLDLVLN